MPVTVRSEYEYYEENESVSEYPPSNVESIARCLADRGVILYGSPNCGRTQGQIEAFEGYFNYIEFVNCKDKHNYAACREAGVGPFPHWFFPDGSYVGGEILDPEELAQMAGCYEQETPNVKITKEKTRTKIQIEQEEGMNVETGETVYKKTEPSNHRLPQPPREYTDLEY